jgi:hypothetical protein
VKATIFLSSEDFEKMLIERWAPRTSTYLQEGPEVSPRKIRISDISMSAYPGGKHNGGYVAFTDEPEEKPVNESEPSPEPSPLPLKAQTDDDTPF